MKTDLQVEPIFHYKTIDDDLYERGSTDIYGLTCGRSIRILLKTYPDGRKAISGNHSVLTRRMRGSGKAFQKWRTKEMFSLRWTKNGMLLATTKNSGDFMASYRFKGEDDPVSRHISYMLDAFSHNERKQVLREYGPLLGFDSDAEFFDEMELDRRTVRSEYNKLIQNIAQKAENHLGDLQDPQECFPLLSKDDLLGDYYGRVIPDRDYKYYVNANDYREVTKRAFGKYNLRKPLVRAVAENNVNFSWYRCFRGLVPVEAIIEAIQRDPGDRSRHLDNEAVIRSIFVRTPQPVLKRILKEPLNESMRAMHDAAIYVDKSKKAGASRDINKLPELIKAKGQKNIRSSRDLETLVASIPAKEEYNRGHAMYLEAQRYYELRDYNELAADSDNLNVVDWQEFNTNYDVYKQHIQDARRARLARQERERLEREEKARQERLEKERERARWAENLGKVLHNKRAGNYTIKIASKADELSEWGALMGNCIGTHGYDLQLGLDVLGAVYDANNKMVLNFEITDGIGLAQFLGAYNKDADRVLPDADIVSILRLMIDSGVKVELYTMGVSQEIVQEARSVDSRKHEVLVGGEA